MRKILFCLLLLLSFAANAAPAPVIVVLGDSLSAAHGIARAQGWVALLEQELDKQGYPHTLINASISGDTTSGGLRRLPKLLSEHQPTIVIIELGGNDGLRALSVKAMQGNLIAMVKQSQAAGAKVLLLGMRIPSNYGPDYTQAFHAVFPAVAKQTGAALVDFFLQPVALQRDYFQADGIHPNAQAQPLLLEHVWPRLKPLLSKTKVSTKP